MINVVGLHAEKAWRIRAHLQRIISSHYPHPLSVGPHRVPLQLYGGPHVLLLFSPLLSPSNDNIKIWFMKTKPIYIVIRVLFFWRLEQWCMRDDGCGTRSVTEQRVLLLLHCPILFMCAHCPTMEFPLLFCPLLIYLVPLPLDHFWSSILITNPHFIIFFFPNKIECHPPQKNGFQYQIVIQWNLP